MLDKSMMIIIFEKLLIQSKNYYEEFNSADAKIGDGDLGVTILNGFEEIINNKDKFKDDLGFNFMVCSQAFVKKSGSSFGTLIAFSFMNIAKNLKDRKLCKHQDIINIIDTSINTIKERGKSNLGDKTILDTLNQILIKLKEENKDVDYAKIFKSATQQSLDLFRGKKILIGRARMFNDKTKDFDDPGMFALNKLAEAFI